MNCCIYREKIIIGILRVIPEEEDGVPLSELADIIDFDLKTPSGKPVIAFKYCPWCGKPREGGRIITDVQRTL